MWTKEMQDALVADGEKLREMADYEHGPFCPRCIVNPLGPKPVFLGAEGEGHICEECWQRDREADENSVNSQPSTAIGGGLFTPDGTKVRAKNPFTGEWED